jgi:sulfonate transport system ATP-binding protein
MVSVLASGLSAAERDEAMTVQQLRRDDFAETAPGRRDRVRHFGNVAVSMRGLRKGFGQNPVLRGIDLDIYDGEFVAIVGRSGCGKSTLLRLLLGLEQPSDGDIRFANGIDQNTHNGAVRIMFQEPRLLPWASVLANVEVGLGSEGVSQDARGRALDTLREVGLEDRRADWPSVLSGGQKQRVALARALVSRPRLLAFDEPLGALDALTRITMQKLIERVWLDQRFTAIMVTHDVAEAVTLADRVLMIEDGQMALNHPIDLPRPRERGSPHFAALEGRILRDLFRNG